MSGTRSPDIFEIEKSDRKIKGLDNGVLKRPGKKRRLGGFADLVADGENPDGLMVQTANGTSRQDMKQQKTVWNANTDRWTKNEDWDGDMSGN